ncbi:MAG: hypothetical protein HYY98_17095 [Burkholderiales bacterium]|nr:hypothetical protein [Burkholderiales bacterium]
MIFSSQFGGGLALGTVVQGVGLAAPEYVACDGRILSRASYARLATLFPFGKLTGTVRALVESSTNYCIAASPNYLVAAAATAASAVQYSTDGASWSKTGVVTPSMAVSSLIFAGSRWIATGGAGTAPAVTTGDNPNSTWAALTGGTPSGVVRYGVAYSAALGRAALISASGSTIHTLENGATALVARTASSQARSGICHTGTQFITLNGATISTSADGITWADAPLPEAASSTAGIASNGAGGVVISGVGSGLLVSQDHGANWAVAAIPGVPADSAWQVYYSGDRFFVPTTRGVAMSLDGRAWFLEPQPIQLRATATMFAKKGGAFLQTQTGSTVAYSFAESATEFNAPLLQAYMPAASGNPIPLPPSYIKAL